MTLYIIGLGLNNEKDITLNALEAIKKCDFIYLENYTSRLDCSKEDLEKLYNKKIILADRNLVENKADEILEKAKNSEVAFLVVGDIFSATTHHDLRLRAIKEGIKVRLIHNTSILTAIGDTGLDLYKFGRTTTICFPEDNFKPESCYDIIKKNKENNMHTLCLLDIKSDLKKFMAVNEALKILLDIEEKRKDKIVTKETLVVGCSGIGTDKEIIKYGKVKDLINFNFKNNLQTLIIPSNLHFIEEEVVELFN